MGLSPRRRDNDGSPGVVDVGHGAAGDVSGPPEPPPDDCARFNPVDLGPWCNVSGAAARLSYTAGERQLRGIPFALASDGDGAPALVLVGPGESVEVPLGRRLDQFVVA